MGYSIMDTMPKKQRPFKSLLVFLRKWNEQDLATFHVIYQTRGRVFPPISKHREVGWKNEARPSFFNQLRGVWKWEETLFRVFDIASQTIDNSWRNSKQSSQNFMIIKITFLNLLHGSDLLCFGLMNFLMSLRRLFQIKHLVHSACGARDDYSQLCLPSHIQCTLLY